ncbi:type VI immunity family protein [Sorangium sp. So ce854]|uniref:type VI immunity family protein n=1 Tax=Sorangium sp. So ce854 TaxID=3133322 RepID=UPI003F641ED8
MARTELPPDHAPLAARLGKPVLYAALGATFHLELLEPDDAGRLDELSAMVMDWIGPYLRAQFGSFLDVPEPFHPRVLDYVASLPEQLDEPAPLDDVVADAFRAQLARRVRTDYHVYVSGAEDHWRASPFTYELWAEMPDEHVHKGHIAAYAAVRVTVPESWPLADFRARVLAMAGALRLRWGAAGLTYAHFLPGDPSFGVHTIWAHARRHVGFDVPFLARNVVPLHDAIRSVSWLTFVGPALAAQRSAPLVRSGAVDVTAAGDNVVLAAGPAPQRGDVNRLDYPAAYVQADQMLRPLRMSRGKELSFLGPWTEDDITGWLRRFERRVA